MKNKSFTLIELLVVIIIIGVLAGVIMVTTTSSVSNATLVRAKAFSSNLQNSMLLNLVAQYELDNNANDSWGYHDGSATNVTYTTGYDGKTNGAGVFNGSAYIRIKDDPAFNFGSQMSAFCWMKGVSQSNRYVFSQFDIGTSQRAWGMFTGDKKLNVIVSKDGTYTDTTSKQYKTGIEILDNAWHFIGFTWNNDLKLYVDGVEASLTKGYDGEFTSIHNSTSDISIGSRFNSNTSSDFFIGSIDNASIYNAALSSSQIKQNYIAGLNSMLANGNMPQEEYNQRINNLATK